MLVINGLEELKTYHEKEVGVSKWVEITQDMINKFAEATGDHQWIHVDVERAKKESPFRTTIAHGFLTLSLLPMLLNEVLDVQGVKFGLNYGTDKVRFMSPVITGSKVRAKMVFSAYKEVEGGLQATFTATFEREGQEKPVCVAESLMRFYA